jgi:nitrogen fixation protein FixH
MSAYRWIPWAFVASLGVVVAVNAAFAYFAISTSPGLVADHPFAEGNDYNRVLAAAAAQDRLGWHGTIGFKSASSRRGELVVTLSDRDGAPLTGLTVSALIERPVEAVPDKLLALPEAGAGRYAGHLALSRRGQWEVHIAARRGHDIFQFAQRIFVE